LLQEDISGCPFLGVRKVGVVAWNDVWSEVDSADVSHHVQIGPTSRFGSGRVPVFSEYRHYCMHEGLYLVGKLVREYRASKVFSIEPIVIEQGSHAVYKDAVHMIPLGKLLGSGRPQRLVDRVSDMTEVLILAIFGVLVVIRHIAYLLFRVKPFRVVVLHVVKQERRIGVLQPWVRPLWHSIRVHVHVCLDIGVVML
jgi:hypothetical protein